MYNIELCIIVCDTLVNDDLFIVELLHSACLYHLGRM